MKQLNITFVLVLLALFSQAAAARSWTCNATIAMTGTVNRSWTPEPWRMSGGIFVDREKKCKQAIQSRFLNSSLYNKWNFSTAEQILLCKKGGATFRIDYGFDKRKKDWNFTQKVSPKCQEPVCEYFGFEDSGSGTNLALSATASSQSAFPGYSASKINDGSTNTTVGGNFSWANAHTFGSNGRLPNWVQLDFGRNVNMSKVVLYTSKGYEIKDYDIQIWNGSSWVTVVAPRNNTSTKRSHTFTPRTGSKIRVVGRRGPDKQSIYVRVNELQVYSR